MQVEADRRDPSAPLPIAAELFRMLEREKVLFGLFKSTASLPKGLAGTDDFDVLVARSDYARFCAVMNRFHAVRGVVHWALSSPGREDWLVPDFARGRYLHLDVHCEVRVGHKFNKVYPLFRYEDITSWERHEASGVSVPVASPTDEARITVARVAYRTWSPPWNEWTRVTGTWRDEICHLLFSEGIREFSLDYPLEDKALRCRLRLDKGELLIASSDLAGLRERVAARSGKTGILGLIPYSVNLVRKAFYRFARTVNRIRPGAIFDKRRSSTGGLLIAVVAPDGLGKSTQIERLKTCFSWKLSCISLYLGYGDGQASFLSKGVKLLYRRKRPKFVQCVRRLDEPVTLSNRAKAVALVLWGVLVAFERRATVMRSRRAASRGFVVICDRWPQNIQPGYLDGPLALPGVHLIHGFNWLTRLERKLHAQAASFRPDLTIQMRAGYEVSHMRKPGELTEDQFDKRICLMDELSRRDPDIIHVDAARPLDRVTAMLFRFIWCRLSGDSTPAIQFNEKSLGANVPDTDPSASAFREAVR